ncbi:site-specific tyrosine recombinase XerD [Xylanimonas protaetiae]|uniref:Tyrosine recombinase XerD n=1 Tax=Xylanimonas protaetiae TaxID=2509457 RepID=A0A4P6FC33_9MICO|nr:site-specific tyrosine recombinase XerD [Xylanimonas protaetiae]QAY71889.1 site-specific tyrosine recombinase XerD [Xylanimonas protaetiae]
MVSGPLEVALDDYLAHLRVERGLSANTTAAYRRDLARYLRHLDRLGRTSLGAVGEDDVTGFVAAVRDGSDGGARLSASSTARALAAVRGWHRFAQAEGLSLQDPAAEVRAPTQLRRLPHALSVDAVTRLLECAGVGDGPVPLRDRALLELLYSTGGRISEVVGLDVDALGWLGAEGDDVPAVVRLHGKGDKERIVPVGSYARSALDAYLVRARPALAAAGSGTPALFLNTRGRPLSRQSAWAVLQAASSRAGLENVSPHTLRHSFATHLLQGGADVRVVQELLGHASVTTTQIYTMVTPDTLREVYAATHPRAL